MHVTLITPCSRPENLFAISESITIPRDHYTWLVVFDFEEFPANIPENCRAFKRTMNGSISGNAQRNLGLSLCHGGHVFFLDDDTVLHPDFWESVKDLAHYDFIHFEQGFRSGGVRLDTSCVAVGQIDSGNFLVSRELIGASRFDVGVYAADGFFASGLMAGCEKDKYLKIPRVLSWYNALR